MGGGGAILAKERKRTVRRRASRVKGTKKRRKAGDKNERPKPGRSQGKQEMSKRRKKKVKRSKRKRVLADANERSKLSLNNNKRQRERRGFPMFTKDPSTIKRRKVVCVESESESSTDLFIIRRKRKNILDGSSSNDNSETSLSEGTLNEFSAVHSETAHEDVEHTLIRTAYDPQDILC